MQQTIIARQSPAPAWIPAIEKKKKIRIPEPHIKLPGRGATGPVPVSTLLNPVLEICNHPDRNRLWEKSSSLCCGIFPENLVFPEAFAVKALVVQRAAKARIFTI